MNDGIGCISPTHLHWEYKRRWNKIYQVDKHIKLTECTPKDTVSGTMERLYIEFSNLFKSVNVPFN